MNPRIPTLFSKSKSAVFGLTLLAAWQYQASGDSPVSFNHDVRPILSENCYACHGPDAEAREAALRFDVEEWAFREREDGPPAIIRGDAENSPMYKRITNTLKSEIMPPPDSHKVLTADHKQLIGQWISEGAKWEGHWSFIKPHKPTVPAVSWGNNEVDRFTYASMQQLGLSPNKEADRPTLARRLSLDLTGLPPTPEIVETFVKDNSSNAYEKLVDRLMDSSAYGEHQARYWLDAARYADTHGLHLDNYREIWPYRDWVIQAFNENKPFDEFTVEQIAGDLLPNPSLEQRLATGFNRCNPTTSEGGLIEEEYRMIYAKNRVETTATVFMGLTMGCAACHDHKFDPWSQKDFYEFSAFFNNFDGPIKDGNAYDTKPIVIIPKPEHQAEWPRIESELENLNQALEQIKKQKQSEYRNWLESEEVTFNQDSINDHIQFELIFGDKEPENKPSNHPVVYASAGEAIDLQENGFSFDPDQPFSLACKIKAPVEAPKMHPRIPLLEQFDGDRGWRLSMANTDKTFPRRYQLTFELIHSLTDNDMISVTSKAERINIRQDASPTIYITYDGSKTVAGLTMTAGSRQVLEYSKVTDNLTGTVATNEKLAVGISRDGVVFSEIETATTKGSVKSVQIFDRQIHAFEVGAVGALSNLRKANKVEEERRSQSQKDMLETYYFTVHDPEYRALKFQHAVKLLEYDNIYDQATVSLVFEEKDEPAFAFMLERGEYDKPGEKVFPNIPEALGGLPEGAPKNRLSLARWLVDPNNPLTARVTVNRFWQNLFGLGLVETSEDFGIMGQNPSHPELLDWLAVHFQETGWNVKNLIKLMVTSASYRQDSTIQKDKYLIDSENRYLARGPRHRLDGEVLRDQALFVSSNMNPKIGGPPVRPYQPEGIWFAVAYTDSNTAHFSQDSGDDLYRRSLYTFWKRTAPPPNMVVFDTPSRETCNVRRERTNTPLQALTLMNDPQYVEAARQLAERVMTEKTGSTEERIAQMYTYAFGSHPKKNHHRILNRSYEKFHKSFDQTPSDAEKLIQVGDSFPTPGLDAVQLASLTMVANQIMNLDSFINKY
jgi:hypothetical protein